MRISDEKLYQLCRRYGAVALQARRKFAGLLPEVCKRELYKKKGFSSIFEFGAKLAGMSKEQVRRVLNLEKRFEKVPRLKELLVNGVVSVNKLVRVASVASSENEKFWSGAALNLPVRALETLVRDEKNAMAAVSTKATQIPEESVHVNTQLRLPAKMSIDPRSLDLKQEVLTKLWDLKEKGIDINGVLLDLLEKRAKEIAEEKQKLAEETDPRLRGDDIGSRPPMSSSGLSSRQAGRSGDIGLSSRSQSGSITKKLSRSIPVRIRKNINKEFGTKCAVPDCAKQSEALHHTNRFSISKNHNPYFLAPLCREHHIIAHAVDMKFQKKRRKFAARGP